SVKRTDVRRLKKRLREATLAQQELGKRMFHLKTLYDLSREIGHLIDSQAIMKNLLMMVIGTFGTFRAIVLLVDTVRGSIAASAQRDLDDAGVGAVGQVVRSAGSGSQVGHILDLSARAGEREAPRGEAAVDTALAGCDLQVWVPFAVNDEFSGGIGLGEKMTG